MENASKALIIAGAILISILIIGLGVYLYSSAASSAKKADLSSQEAQSHNGSFEQYFGSKVSSTDVKNLMSLIRTNNITGKTGDKTQQIYVLFGADAKETSTTDVSKNVKSGKTYNVNTENDNAFTDEGTGTNTTTEKVKTGDPAYYDSGYIRIITIKEN